MNARRLSLAFVLLAGVGCSTLSAPVLRHETGETLGPGHFRVLARMESSRIFSLVPGAFGALGIAQQASVFTGSIFGFLGSVGVFPKFDVEAQGFLLQSGGGWKVGAKYELLRKNGLAVAVNAAYGASSGAGSILYLTTTGLTNVTQILASNTVELSVPVSFRFTPSIALYSGLTYYHTEADGVVATTYTLSPMNDMGMNLGLRLNFGMVEGDVEAALLRFYDPFADSMRILPFFGIAGGIVF